MGATYTVKKGDTLSAIARKYGTTYQEIAKENGISNPNLIHPGQTLTIGGSTKTGKTNNTNNTGTTGSGNGGSKQPDTPKVDTSTVVTQPVAGTPKVEEPKIATNQPVTSLAGFTYGDFQYGSFDPMADENIKQAWDVLNQHSASNPGEFTDPNNYKDTYMGYLNQYENRDPFSYDFNSDALYNMYKDQYIQQGQMAMMDTMGQAAAMTGGYGNSYAQTVGQQAYNQQLSQLNEVMPELYNMAYNRYNQEGQEMLDMYNAYLGLYQNDYGMHQDSLDNWYRENSRLQENYDTLYGQGYDNYLLGYNTALNEYNTDRSEEFSKWQTQQNQEWQAGEAEKDRLHQTEENEKSRNFTSTENDKSRAESNKANAKSDLINLITSTGYNPSDSELAAAGMSREQANSYKDAYTASQTKDPTYHKLEAGSEAYKIISKDIGNAASLDALNDITLMYIGLGYDPEQIKAMMQSKLKELTPSTPTTLLSKGNTGGSGAGGRMLWEQR